MLSGWLYYAACGAGMPAAGYDKSGRARIRCFGSVDNGTCPDPKPFYLDLVEKTVVNGLKRDPVHPDVIADYGAEHNARQTPIPFVLEALGCRPVKMHSNS